MSSFRRIFQGFVQSKTLKRLTGSPNWTKKISYKKRVHPGCNWAGARAPRTMGQLMESADNQLRRSSGNKSASFDQAPLQVLEF